MKEITCTDNFTFWVEQSNSTSSSENVPGLQHNMFYICIFVMSLSLGAAKPPGRLTPQYCARWFRRLRPTCLTPQYLNGAFCSIFQPIIILTKCETKLRRFISHTFRYHSPSYHSRHFLCNLTCKCLWISSH